MLDDRNSCIYFIFKLFWKPFLVWKLYFWPPTATVCFRFNRIFCFSFNESRKTLPFYFRRWSISRRKKTISFLCGYFYPGKYTYIYLSVGNNRKIFNTHKIAQYMAFLGSSFFLGRLFYWLSFMFALLFVFLSTAKKPRTRGEGGKMCPLKHELMVIHPPSPRFEEK